MAVVLLAAIGWGGLTARRGEDHAESRAAAEIDYSAPTDWMHLSPEEMAGIAYFRQENCMSCHAVGDRGRQGGAGSDAQLASTRTRRG